MLRSRVRGAADALGVIERTGFMLAKRPEHISAEEPALRLRGYVLQETFDERLGLGRFTCLEQQSRTKEVHHLERGLQSRRRFEIGGRLRPLLMVTKKLPAPNEQVCLRRLREFLCQGINQELIVTMRANVQRPKA